MLSFSRDVRQRIAIILIVAVGVGVLALVAPFMGALLLALVIHVVVAPVHRALVTRVSPAWASTIVIVGVIVLLLGPMAWLISLLVDQLPGVMQTIRDRDLINTVGRLRIGPVDIGARLEEAGATVAQWAATQATAIIGGAANTILDLVISLFALYFLLQSGDAMWRSVRPLIPFSERHADELLQEFRSATHSTLLGSGLIALMQGTLVGLTFWIVGLPQALFWGVIATIASIIPLVGATIVWIPGVVVVATQGRYPAAIGMAAFCGIVISSIDNFVRPILSERMSAVHPMITLIGAFAGMRVFGLMGLLLGPLSISYFFVLVRMYGEEYSPTVTASPGATEVGSGR